MICYPIQQLVTCGIEDILVVTGGGSSGDFLELLGNGEEFGLKHLNYAYQDGEGGIAEALGLAKDFSAGEPLMVLLGDNLFQDSLEEAIGYYSLGEGAMIFLKEVDDPERFGVAILEGDRVVKVVEKPNTAQSNFAVTGCYFFDFRVFEIIEGLQPSSRGELEITDVNNKYIEWGEMKYQVLDGWWADAGTVESLARASRLVSEDYENPVLRGTSMELDSSSQYPSE
jgi:glucose-1-phosphate thymidylyltransferase